MDYYLLTYEFLLIGFSVKCYRHSGNEYNLRAHLEDLIEIEKRRTGKNWGKADAKMNFADGSRILNAAVRVMRVLGWSWRWAEWWVDYNSSWEPLLEPHEKEEDMTKEQLKIVDSTRESRAADARKCRLATFGAALRNRAYDTESEFDSDALDRALRAVLHTKSLVGPMEKYEIDFFADWLGRAYKSKSRILGFGEDKIEVAREAFCLHMEDQTPKFELGDRTLPGKQKPGGRQKFETGIVEVDDFLKTELLEDAYVPEEPSVTSSKRGPGRPSKAGPRDREAEREKRRERDRRRREREREAREELQRKRSRVSGGEASDSAKTPLKRNRKDSTNKSSDETPRAFTVYRLPDGKFARRYESDNLIESEIPRPGEKTSLSSQSGTNRKRDRKAERERRRERERLRREQEREGDATSEEESEFAAATSRGRGRKPRQDMANDSDRSVTEVRRRRPNNPRVKGGNKSESDGDTLPRHRLGRPKVKREDDSDTEPKKVQRRRPGRPRVKKENDAEGGEARRRPGRPRVKSRDYSVSTAGGSRSTPARAARPRQLLSEDYPSEFELDSTSDDEDALSRTRSRRGEQSSESETNVESRRRKRKRGSLKRKRKPENDAVAAARPKKKLGRPLKNPPPSQELEAMRPKKKLGRPFKKRGRPFKNPPHSHEPSDEIDLLDWKIPKKEDSKTENGPESENQGAVLKKETVELSRRKMSTGEESVASVKESGNRRTSRFSRRSAATGASDESENVMSDSHTEAETRRDRNSHQRRRRLRESDEEESTDEIDEDDIPLDKLVALEKAKEGSSIETPGSDEASATIDAQKESDSELAPQEVSRKVPDKKAGAALTAELSPASQEDDSSGNGGHGIETHRRLARMEGKEDAIRLFK